jgi:hypothetical protein
MSIVSRPGSPVWNYEFVIEGRRLRGPTPFSLDDPLNPKRRGRNYKLAQEWEGAVKVKTRRDIASGKTSSGRNSIDLSIEQMFREYLESEGPNRPTPTRSPQTSIA